MAISVGAHARLARVVASGACAFSFLAAAHPAEAMAFRITYDAGTPAGLTSAFDTAVAWYQTLFSDPITVNIEVGWGDVAGQSISAGNIAQTVAFQQTFSGYDQVHAALTSDATSAADRAALQTLGADPTGGRPFTLSTAQAKALGLIDPAAAALDGYIGFNSSAPWSFNPDDRGTSDTWDFIGIAEHEIAEVLGRYGYGQNGQSPMNSPIDLFRYSAPGTRVLDPGFYGENYFSVDGGRTDLRNFNVLCCGDLSDWASGTPDAFNAFPTFGTVNGFSAVDMTVMDVIGYDPAVSGAAAPPVPEPGTISLISIGAVVAAVSTWRRGRGRARAAAPPPHA